METYEFYARCASGFEALLATELKNLKAQRVRPLKGGVAFFGTVREAYRACLWSRVASRVLLVLARVDASDAEALYAGAKALDWTEHVGEGATIAVYAHGMNDNLRNTQFTAVKVKDAVCDALREARGARPDVRSKRPDVAIDVAVRGEKATISLDLSGEPLHRRGYRTDGVQTEAPLKETLAAGIVLAAGWERTARVCGTFIDPMCGSGTLVIEAAMIAADRAPGIMRDYWGFSGWALHDEDLWDALIDEADDRLAAGLESMPRLVGTDVDEKSVQIARENAKRAGLARYVDFRGGDAAQMGEILADGATGATDAPGLVAVNPPYGSRLSSEAQLPGVYAALAQGVSAVPDGWTLAVITPDATIDTALGLVPRETLGLYNGPLAADLRIYETAPSARIELKVVSLAGDERYVTVAEPTSDQFIARFRKVAKERTKWARKNGISCYRLYDADLPDFAVAVDLYETAGPSVVDAVEQACGKARRGVGENSTSIGGGASSAGERYVHISEYEAPPTVDAERAQRRFRDALAIVPTVLGLDPSHVFSKTRRRDKGGGQYRDARGRSHIVCTEESGYRFEVDLGGYLDTGIFLDHRKTRELVGSLAKGARFLNLFAYTGTASVHAAGGGAVSTVTVDLSQTYLSWAERNMRLNGFKGRNHTYVRADVLRWISEERASKRRYDLIFVDPPTFSNSKSMGKETWSVQRDHAELVIGVSRLLAQGGRAVFSCNLRSFKPDTEKLERYGVHLTDISAETIPEDFARNPKIHKCYLVERVAAGSGVSGD
ncbi:bifunctional 23S rRNA (guanine(2069)-N(7))-methyltransferase RlmK/23S rRNA (guanine(2445)-N(2))-methyltransferase RlmL [Raoultibacter phocaeensis]|uniref:bifunctional 23S rRNA (guanine(2069)-N(7))-methyltransferase RlmK/23S rRNA (guanine(2445)-N(2))-methyltransferase RlmL n=1 Tax=Raoultibacter phocaeensis TaxID=2479841 RepID=UPI00210700C4|nr:bifunctional 23S rRNA (guanine(2069)-N(7))-methyltransferase RlmK/23S rRNA (guanine(2445)-N(2))-methyltransferase RlmL [Raoultibacter phocaeensis]